MLTFNGHNYRTLEEQVAFLTENMAEDRKSITRITFGQATDIAQNSNGVVITCPGSVVYSDNTQTTINVQYALPIVSGGNGEYDTRLAISNNKISIKTINAIAKDVVKSVTVVGNQLIVVTNTGAQTFTLASGGTTYTAGQNISISGNVISAVDTTYRAGNGLALSNNEFSAKVDGSSIVFDENGALKALGGGGGGEPTVAGVASIGGQTGAITTGTGISMVGKAITNAGVTSISSMTGAVAVDNTITAGSGTIGVNTTVIPTKAMVNAMFVYSNGTLTITTM